MGRNLRALRLVLGIARKMTRMMPRAKRSQRKAGPK